MKPEQAGRIRTLRRPQPPTLSQRVEQRFRRDEVGGLEALFEPVVDGLQQLAGLAGSALPMPEASEARGTPQFPR